MTCFSIIVVILNALKVAKTEVQFIILMLYQPYLLVTHHWARTVKKKDRIPEAPRTQVIMSLESTIAINFLTIWHRHLVVDTVLFW